MDRYFYARTAAQMDAFTDDQLAGMIEYLTTNGLTVSNVWTHNAPTPGIELEASADPTALLQAWTPAPSAERRDVGDSLTWLHDTYLPILRAWKAGTGPAPTIGQVTRATAELTIVDLALAKRLSVG